MDSQIAVSMIKDGEATTMATDATGEVAWPMDAKYESYRIDHPGYASLEGQLEMANVCPKPDMLTVTLTRLVEIDLGGLFNWDMSDIKPEGKQVLDEVITYMKEVTDVRVELSARTPTLVRAQSTTSTSLSAVLKAAWITWWPVAFRSSDWWPQATENSS